MAAGTIMGLPTPDERDDDRHASIYITGPKPLAG
ncbi:unannotated protein [freshwater metagenome]|uniref:Unannotated protein n=1 Tax=freshwater metagenome TaxID=449393 RepID=A0A6J7DY65_9ZZZZ